MQLRNKAGGLREEWFQERVEQMYRVSSVDMCRLGLEIHVARGGHFLLGDRGTLVLDPNGGLVEGPFFNRGSQLLPLTPKIVISLGPKDLWNEVDESTVDMINDLSVRASRRNVFSAPSSSLTEFIRLHSSR